MFGDRKPSIFDNMLPELKQNTSDIVDLDIKLERAKYTNTCGKGSQRHNYNCNIQGVSVYTNVSANYMFRPLLVRPSSGWIP